MGNGLLNNLGNTGGGNGGGGNMGVILLVVCCLCCISSSGGLGGFYFFYDPFKKWVNNLLGMGGGTGRGCRPGYTFGTGSAGKPYCKNDTTSKTYKPIELSGVKDVNGVQRGCPPTASWNSAGDKCCYDDGKCYNAGTVYAGA